jgi:penicillin V acylase-like amidase (Ntn superfamily)
VRRLAVCAPVVVAAACCLVVGGRDPIAIAGKAQVLDRLEAGSSCSALSVTAGGCAIFGANLDYRYHCRGQLFINPRGLHKTGVITSATGDYAEWVAEYASLTFNFVGYQFAWGGMNEAGLVMSTMALPQTECSPPDHRPVIDSGMWMQYILDTCATVDEVIAADEEVRNITVDHYLVSDRSGASAVIEYVDGEFVAHTGGDLPVSVLSNWFYDESLAVWQLYGGLGNYAWMDGSMQRFCIAADRVSSFEGSSAEEGVEFAFDTLDAIAGQRFSPDASQWSLVFDTGALRAYFTTYADPRLRYVDLQEFSPWCGQPVQMLDIDEAVVGDTGPWFGDYSHAEARDHLLWFINFWETDVSSVWVDQMIRHFEGFTCDPPRRMRRAAGRRGPG